MLLFQYLLTSPAAAALNPRNDSRADGSLKIGKFTLNYIRATFKICICMHTAQDLRERLLSLTKSAVNQLKVTNGSGTLGSDVTSEANHLIYRGAVDKVISLALTGQ
jgi:hypothetical protein